MSTAAGIPWGRRRPGDYVSGRGLALGATVAAVSTGLPLMAAATPVLLVEQLFRDDPVLRAVAVVLDHDASPESRWALLTRGRLQTALVGRLGYGRAVHARRPAVDVVARGALVLPAELPLAAASARVLDRPAEERYDDVLVLPPEGSDEGPSLLVVSEVFRHLAGAYRFLASRDPVTHLLNRLSFEELGREVLGAADEGCALLYVDLDGFKDVNDTLGHRAGDDVLRDFGQRLVGSVRTQDVVARLGGDEFAILLPGVGEQEALAVADRVVLVAAAPFVVAGHPVSLSASVGVALDEDVQTDTALSPLDALLRHADGAMLQAKASGRSRVGRLRRDTGALQDPSTRAALRRRLAVALREGGLRLHYQPKVDIVSGSVVEMEALLRWTDDELGPVSPAVFVPVAEASGQILAVGRWVLDEACAEASRWRTSGWGWTVSVNVSAVQLANPELVTDVARALARHGLPPDRLRLEVTETAAVLDLHGTLQQLVELRDLGVRLSLDDFGTGYSSLAMLRRLPVHTVKIDKAFIDHLDDEPADALLVGGVIQVAHALGLSVVAEGVERVEQLSQLRRLGCDVAQGFLLARPAPAHELPTLVAAVADSMATSSPGRDGASG